MSILFTIVFINLVIGIIPMLYVIDKIPAEKRSKQEKELSYLFLSALIWEIVIPFYIFSKRYKKEIEIKEIR